MSYSLLQRTKTNRAPTSPKCACIIPDTKAWRHDLAYIRGLVSHTSIICADVRMIAMCTRIRLCGRAPAPFRGGGDVPLLAQIDEGKESVQG